ncbi:hypothetical protein Pelo_8817 [Pelomyxa schiedti]|nr:hypothetical protein Pelo_8817 [Pelomyxa schiedti]
MSAKSCAADTRRINMKRACVVQWDPHGGCGIVIEARGKLLNTMGATRRISLPSVGGTSASASPSPSSSPAALTQTRTVLEPEEVVFLVDQNAAVLRLGTTDSWASIQQAFNLLLESGISIERYMVYAHLRHMGYIVIPVPYHTTPNTSNPTPEMKIPSIPAVTTQCTPIPLPNKPLGAVSSSPPPSYRGWWPRVNLLPTPSDCATIITKLSHPMDTVPDSISREPLYHIDFKVYYPGTNKYRTMAPHLCISVINLGNPNDLPALEWSDMQYLLAETHKAGATQLKIAAACGTNIVFFSVANA